MCAPTHAHMHKHTHTRYYGQLGLAIFLSSLSGGIFCVLYLCSLLGRLDIAFRIPSLLIKFLMDTCYLIVLPKLLELLDCRYDDDLSNGCLVFPLGYQTRIRACQTQSTPETNT